VIHDISSVAGFLLSFDDRSLSVVAGPGFGFVERSLTVDDLRIVLESPDSAPADREVYRTYLPRTFPTEAATALDRLDLTYSLVAVRAGCIGREFDKTRGHLHAILPGTSLTSPEIYAQLSGRLTLLLQRTATAEGGVIEDFVVIDLVPGSLVVIPPGYAHGLANPYGEAAILAGLYSDPVRYPPRYEPISRYGGFAYRVVTDGPAGSQLVPNERYASVPPPRVVAPSADGEFATPDPSGPLWTSFLHSPDAYRFLSRGDAAQARFRTIKSGPDDNR
jgi:oxalate decarboxylase/phosphoglucose isomerase-like protein (cupin superfamily)